MNTTFENKEVACRKDHYCIWCGEIISKGETARHYKGVFEGDLQDWHMHPECYKDAEDELESGFTPYANERG